MPKFHYIYLAQNLLKTRSPTCFEQKKSRGPGLRLVCDLVSDKSETWIDVMEFGLKQNVSTTSSLDIRRPAAVRRASLITLRNFTTVLLSADTYRQRRQAAKSILSAVFNECCRTNASLKAARRISMHLLDISLSSTGIGYAA